MVCQYDCTDDRNNDVDDVDDDDDGDVDDGDISFGRSTSGTQRQSFLRQRLTILKSVSLW